MGGRRELWLQKRHLRSASNENQKRDAVGRRNKCLRAGAAFCSWEVSLELKLGQGWKDIEFPREAIVDWGLSHFSKKGMMETFVSWECARVVWRINW